MILAKAPQPKDLKLKAVLTILTNKEGIILILTIIIIKDTSTYTIPINRTCLDIYEVILFRLPMTIIKVIRANTIPLINRGT